MQKLSNIIIVQNTNNASALSALNKKEFEVALRGRLYCCFEKAIAAFNAGRLSHIVTFLEFSDTNVAIIPVRPTGKTVSLKDAMGVRISHRDKTPNMIAAGIAAGSNRLNGLWLLKLYVACTGGCFQLSQQKRGLFNHLMFKL
jgi:hypothetical protein